MNKAIKHNLRLAVILTSCLAVSYGVNANVAQPVSQKEKSHARETAAAGSTVQKVSSANGSVMHINTAISSGQTPAADTSQRAIIPDSTKKERPGWQKFKEFFTESNKVKKNKKFDFSIIGGPHYSSDVKLGLGIVASGLYRMDRKDSLLPPSNVSMFGDIATSGFYMIGIRGDNIFPQDKYRLNYVLYTYSFPSVFWGIGYDMASDDANKSSYKRKQYQVRASFLFRTAKNLYIGPDISFDYIYGKDLENRALLRGQDTYTYSTGIGASLVYDSRDVLTNAYKGFYVKLSQKFFPSFLGNKYDFTRTELQADYYQKAWKGAVFAFDFYSELNYGDTPWTMMARLGGSYRMRGYYEGQYRDNDIMVLQMELRQHIWHRHGVAAWVGAGNVFKNFNSFHWNQTLPNYGIGYRWEFKNRVNVRLDYGFGKGQSGFLFQINEAF